MSSRPGTAHRKTDAKGMEMWKGHYSNWLHEYPMLSETQITRLAGDFRYPFLNTAMIFQPVVRKCLVLQLFYFLRVVQKIHLVYELRSRRNKGSFPDESQDDESHEAGNLINTTDISRKDVSAPQAGDKSSYFGDSALGNTQDAEKIVFPPSDEFVVGIIGAGEIGKNFLDLLLDSGTMNGKHIYVSTRRPDTMTRYTSRGVVCGFDNTGLVKVANIVYVLCLPSQLKDVSSDIKGQLQESVLLVTVQPGYTKERVQQQFDVVHVMKTNIDMKFVDLYCSQQRNTPTTTPVSFRTPSPTRFNPLDSSKSPDMGKTTFSSHPLAAYSWTKDSDLSSICSQSLISNGPNALNSFMKALESVFIKFGESEEQAKRNATQSVFGNDIDYHALSSLYSKAAPTNESPRDSFSDSAPNSYRDSDSTIGFAPVAPSNEMASLELVKTLLESFSKTFAKTLEEAFP